MTPPLPPQSATSARYLILGAGPAGLTMAKMLTDRGAKDVILIEASNKVGGKCLSSEIGDHIVEFGTCYAVWSHKYILKQMKKLGIKRNFLRAQRIDDRELMDYIRDGSGPGFLWQVFKYLRLRKRLIDRAEANDPEVNKTLAQPTSDWLRDNNLGKIENMMHRVVTSIGYGYLNKLPLIHAFRWVDFNMMVTGLLKFTVMPDGGWQNFWNRFSEGLDIRLGQGATEIRRDESGIRVVTTDGAEYRADKLINTIPMHEFCKLTSPSQDEIKIAEAIDWGGYTTSLLSVADWPHKAPVNSWSATCATDANDGQILFSRFECDDESERHLFTVGQLSSAYELDELTELALFSSRERGAVDPRLIQQIVWSYMPTYKAEAVRDGLIAAMAQMQGKNRTFHSGASFSHEAVSTISSFNEQLLAKVAP
nr:FAD-dependent oxidoreductase [Hyphomonas sp. Mor2]